MPDYYPLNLDVRGRRCVVVGGGSVAERKVSFLVECGALVTVVSPRLTEGLERMVASGTVEAVRRDFSSGDLSGARLAFAATDSCEVNRAVAAEARRAGVLVNVADDPAYCDFILPAVVSQGDVTISISTGGRSPALARFLREKLEELIGPEYGALAAMVADVRSELRSQGRRPTAAQWQAALDESLVGLVEGGRTEEARARLLSRLM